MHKSFVDEDLIGTSWLVFRLQACGYNFIHIVEYPVSSWFVKAILFCDYQHFQIHTQKKNFQTGNFGTAFYENQLVCVWMWADSILLCSTREYYLPTSLKFTCRYLFIKIRLWLKRDDSLFDFCWLIVLWSNGNTNPVPVCVCLFIEVCALLPYVCVCPCSLHENQPSGLPAEFTDPKSS